MSDHLRVCQQAALAGGEVLLTWIGRFQAQEKGPSDLVTEADIASQTAIRDLIFSEFPNHGFVSEEGDAVNQAAEFCWVVDPLDGTTNYVHQFPHYAVSVALLCKGRPVVGAVFDPVHDECFTAVRGNGARLNGLPIRTSGVSNLAQALAAASFSAKVEPDSPEIHQFVAALLDCQAVGRTGSAALNLCYVANGRFDAFWAMSTKIWDVAAGVLMVEEAGGVVSSLDGQPFNLRLPHPVASATRNLHEQMLFLLQNAGNRGATGG